MSFEITEDEHPVLFEFIYRLCEEVGSPLREQGARRPRRERHVHHEREPSEPVCGTEEADLLIGLGLVNAVNMSEFKAILAHEFMAISATGRGVRAVTPTSLRA